MYVTFRSLLAICICMQRLFTKSTIEKLSCHIAKSKTSEAGRANVIKVQYVNSPDLFEYPSSLHRTELNLDSTETSVASYAKYRFSKLFHRVSYHRTRLMIFYLLPFVTIVLHFLLWLMATKRITRFVPKIFARWSLKQASGSRAVAQFSLYYSCY
jgi:hypothetical protein